MLEYDEWVLPEEVEYAKKKDAEIEERIQRRKCRELGDEAFDREAEVAIQLTEHVIGIYDVIYFPPNDWDWDWWDEEQKLRDIKRRIGPIEKPRIFNLPAGDIRNSLPEWDESLIPADSWMSNMWHHALRHIVDDNIKARNGDYDDIKEEFNLDDAECSNIMNRFAKKLGTQDAAVIFTEWEERIADYMKADNRHYPYYRDYDFRKNVPKLWYFPLNMTEGKIMEAVCAAYLSAGKRSRRIMPDDHDYINISMREYHSKGLGNYKCLYQGRAGDMTIRFLFDYENMKIVTAYPVPKYDRQLSESASDGWLWIR